MSPEKETPIPCRRCGAPMIEEPSAHVHLQLAVTVRCDYCHSREELPADASQRVMMLRRRLAEIRAAQNALEGPALAIASVAERYPKMILPGAVLMLGMGGLSAIQSFLHASSLPAEGAVRMNVMISAAAAPVQVLFMVVSVFGGATLALRQYARALRPALEARPPRGGNHYRCRSCGGAIDAGARHGAFVGCSYCGAQNLLGKSNAAGRATQLDREIEEYRLRAAGHQPVIAQAAERYSRRLHVLMGVVAVTNLFLMLAVSQVQQHLATVP